MPFKSYSEVKKVRKEEHASQQMGHSAREGIRHVDLTFKPAATHELSFSRADLVFMGVDHSALSYEVRIYLNNKAADGETARTANTGYAGRFTVFGHGNCFGEDGHCDVPVPLPGAPLTTQHPLIRQRMMVPITKSLKRVCQGGGQLKSVTLVPILKAPKRDQQGEAPFAFDSVSLRTYR